MFKLFSGTPKHKIYAQYDEFSREELIDQLLVADEQRAKDANHLRETINLYEERAAETARKQKIKDDDAARERKQADEDKDRAHAQVVADLTASHLAEVEKLKKDHELALADAELNNKYNESRKVTEATEARIEAEKELAVASAKNEMLEQMVDLNGDIVDIKDMANKIIDKLPTINLTSLPSAAAPAKEKKQD